MEILANLGKLKDGSTALVLKDAYNPNYAIVRNYDESAPLGQKWSSGTYFDGNLLSFINAVQKIEVGMSLDDARDYFREYISDDYDNYDENEITDKLSGIMGKDEIEALGFDTDALGIEEDF